MKSLKTTVLINKINELIKKETNFNPAELYTLNVEQILVLAEELLPEWHGIIKTEEPDQKDSEVQRITNFFMKAFELRNLYVEASSFFRNITLSHIKEKGDDLGFNLVEDNELSEIVNDLMNPKNNIQESIEVLHNPKVAASLCKNFNEIHLQEKITSILGAH